MITPPAYKSQVVGKHCRLNNQAPPTGTIFLILFWHLDMFLSGQKVKIIIFNCGQVSIFASSSFECFAKSTELNSMARYLLASGIVFTIRR